MPTTDAAKSSMAPISELRLDGFAAVDDVHDRSQLLPARLVLRPERRAEQREIEGAHPERIAVGDEGVRHDAGEGRIALIHAGRPDHQQLPLLDRRQRGKHRNAVALRCHQAEVAVCGDKLGEVRLAGRLTKCTSVPPQPLDACVVAVWPHQHLGVAVHHRSAGAPTAVPDQQVRGGVGIRGARPLRPGPCHREDVEHLVAPEGERVVLVEDDHPVMRVVRGGVCAGDRVTSSNPPPAVRRSVCLGRAERVPSRLGNPPGEVLAAGAVHRAEAAEGGEASSLQGPSVRGPHDGLLADRVDRAEVSGEPVGHLGRRISVGRGHHDPEEALDPLPGLRREAGDDRGELGDGAQPFSSQARGWSVASHSSRSWDMITTSTCSPSRKCARRRVPSTTKPAFS